MTEGCERERDRRAARTVWSERKRDRRDDRQVRSERNPAHASACKMGRNQSGEGSEEERNRRLQGTKRDREGEGSLDVAPADPCSAREEREAGERRRDGDDRQQCFGYRFACDRGCGADRGARQRDRVEQIPGSRVNASRSSEHDGRAALSEGDAWFTNGSGEYGDGERRKQELCESQAAVWRERSARKLRAGERPKREPGSDCEVRGHWLRP